MTPGRRGGQAWTAVRPRGRGASGPPTASPCQRLRAAGSSTAASAGSRRASRSSVAPFTSSPASMPSRRAASSRTAFIRARRRSSAGASATRRQTSGRGHSASGSASARARASSTGPAMRSSSGPPAPRVAASVAPVRRRLHGPADEDLVHQHLEGRPVPGGGQLLAQLQERLQPGELARREPAGPLEVQAPGFLRRGGLDLLEEAELLLGPGEPAEPGQFAREQVGERQQVRGVGGRVGQHAGLERAFRPVGPLVALVERHAEALLEQRRQAEALPSRRSARRSSCRRGCAR